MTTTSLPSEPVAPAAPASAQATPAPRYEGLLSAGTGAGPWAALTGLGLAACGGGEDGGEGGDAAPAAGTGGAGADAERARAGGLSTTAGSQAGRVAYTAEELTSAFAPDGVGLATAVEASRFLAQASFGPTVSTLAAVRTRGLAGWLDDQFVAPRGPRLVGRVLAQRDALGGWLYTTPTFGSPNSEFTMNECWRVAMTEPDQLRQRVVAALLEIFVITTRVGVVGIGQNQVNSAAFVDMLGDHAFGNFRQLLEGVTLSTAMGVYLSYRDNQKAEYDLNGMETRVPDENFARELMQLFSIGLVQLNADGSPKLKRNLPQETYTQSDVFNLARVFTGWKLQKPVAGEDPLAPWAKPMEADADLHSPEEKAFLGKVIPAGTGPTVSLRRALDTIFEHDNVGPFIGKQLIQRLVTSNPSALYVGRVTAVFNDNGAGVRGDLKAVIRAVLLDPEARTGSLGSGELSDIRGKVREPMIRLIAMARAMEVGDPGGVIFPVANLSGASTGVGQSPLKSPSVFNFFRPGYAAPQSVLGSLGYVAPEYQLLNGPVIAASVNKINEFVRVAQNYLLVDIAHLRDLAGRPRALVERVSLLLTGSTLPLADVDAFTQVVGKVAAKDTRLRAQVALQLVASSAAFLVQKW